MIQHSSKNSFTDFHAARLIYQRHSFIDSYADFSFSLSLAAFYQINRFQLSDLYDKVVELINPNRSKKILEVYCGMGILARFLADKVTSIIASDLNPDNIKIAQKLASNHTNFEIYCEDALESIKKYSDITTLIVNPPRKGLDSRFIETCVKVKMNEIIYISCSSKTLLRDLLLFKKNAYEITDIYPFDMFPHTHHIENLVRITK
jgi:23S rRNA (uracil1939-C5)-methyltransferase